MKKFILLIFLFPLFTSAQTYLKVADREEYARYVEWCKDSISVDIIQYGKATVVNQGVMDYQLYKAIYGRYSPSLLKDTFWYQQWRPGIKTTAISLTSDQVLLQRKVRIRIQRQKPTVSNYYLIREQWRNL